MIPIWTRNVGLLAATFSTLDELAPGRIILGLGAWWEPLASQGRRATGEQPLQAMREVVEATRRLLAMERVTYHGEFVHLDDVEIDVVHGDRSPRQVPIYVGRHRHEDDGARRARSATASCSTTWSAPTTTSGPWRRSPPARTGRAAASPTSTGRSWSSARSTPTATWPSTGSRELLTQYLGQQPHIMKASGVDPELIEEIGKILTWPASPEDIRKAMRLVPDEAVQMISASGTPGRMPRQGERVHRQRRDLPDPLPAR